MNKEERRLFEAYRFLLKVRWESLSKKERKQHIRRLMYARYGCYDNADAALVRVLEN